MQISRDKKAKNQIIVLLTLTIIAYIVFVVIGMNKNNYSDDNMNSSDREYVVSDEKAIEWIYLGDIFVAVWNKIYSMQFLKK